MAARSTMLLVLAIVAAVFAVGCGSGGDGGEEEATAAAPPALTWPQFVKKANALCRSKRKTLPNEIASFWAREKHSHYSQPVLNWRLAHYVLLPKVEEQIAGLYKLVPPSADLPGIEASLGAMETAKSKVNGAGKIASMKAYRRYFTEAGAELRANELDDCTDDGR